jgi:hypothetical protein
MGFGGWNKPQWNGYHVNEADKLQDQREEYWRQSREDYQPPRILAKANQFLA